MAEREWSGQSGAYDADRSTASQADIKTRVQETASRISQSAADAVDSGRTAAAQGMQGAADSLRSASEHLPGGPKVRQFAHRTADGLDRTVRYLRERQARDIWMDIQEGAKARPVPFLVGALAVGFVAGRVLRRG
jgi:hypothetical protein